jgi:hypothetical protein
VIQLDLHDRTSALAVRARECLQQWDIRRAAEGEQEGWDVLLHPVPEGILTHTRFTKHYLMTPHMSSAPP